MFIASIVGLAVLVATAVVALNAAHIPVLREWVGAAPLQHDEPAADTSKETRP